MFDTAVLLPLIPGLPLAAAVLTPILGFTVLRRAAHLPALIGMILACIFSCMLLANVSGQPSAEGEIGYSQVYTLWTWADVEGAYSKQPPPDAATDAAAPGGRFDFDIEVALRADTLTAVMLVMVTFISTLVVIFSIGYMHGDPGYWRFFSYVSLFVFSMSMLVSVSNFLLLFVFWEAVGVCSYLLIGFWYQKPSAAAAGQKAFLVNRVGDFGFMLGVFLIWTTYGTLDFHDSYEQEPLPGDVAASMESGPAVKGVLGNWRLEREEEGFVAGSAGFAICLLLLLGACGKSAQFPLHVWLPDAMEGPTPVSALIHAATMVTAGVYLVARCAPLFYVSPEAQLAVACIGALTALLAGLIALTQTDLKRVLAYSTVSQLGYMFLALGTGSHLGVIAGMFHLFTHAFFKALLFLGSGSVMHAMGNVIDMTRFGGLRKILPITCITFAVGCLALSGIPPLAGFFSKDMILAAVHEKAHAHGTYFEIYEWLYYGAMFTAFLTAFYTFRAFFLTFFGEEHVPEEAHGHAHESPRVMWVPLAVLAVCAATVGFLEPLHVFGPLLDQTPQLAYAPIQATAHHGADHTEIAMVSVIVALVGIGIAAFLYCGDRREVGWLSSLLKFEWLGRAASSNWAGAFSRLSVVRTIDRAAAVVGLLWLVRAVGWLLLAVASILMLPLLLLYWVSPYRLSKGKFYFDEIYNALIVRPLSAVAQTFYWIDQYLIDGLVNLCGRIPPAVGRLLRSLQMGLVQFYALAMVLGLLVLLAARMVFAG